MGSAIGRFVRVAVRISALLASAAIITAVSQVNMAVAGIGGIGGGGKGRNGLEIPALRVNRFRSPRWLCHLMVKQQRIGIRRSGANYPFQFKHGGKNFAFFPKG